MSLAYTVALGALLLVASMAFAWGLVKRFSNGGLADVVWTFALGATALYFSLKTGSALSHPERSFLSDGAIILWTMRLGVPLWRRNVGGSEDVRYSNFRTQWGSKFLLNLFGLLMIQAVAGLLLALTVMWAARNPLPLGTLDALGIAVMLAALCGGYLADSQLAQFKRNPTNHGKICDAGLWGRSRHPNYFFEVMFWSGWPLLAISGGWRTGAWAIIGPVFMYWLLRHVSGEPMVEANMARRYGQAFEEYRLRVPPFIPRLLTKQS